MAGADQQLRLDKPPRSPLFCPVIDSCKRWLLLHVQNESPVIPLGDVLQPLFTSGSKFSHGCDVPEELQGLSMAEQALISRVQCVMTCQHIKGTGTGSSTNVLKSHVTFVDRTDCVQKLHQTLPLLASEVQVLVLQA